MKIQFVTLVFVDIQTKATVCEMSTVLSFSDGNLLKVRLKVWNKLMITTSAWEPYFMFSFHMTECGSQKQSPLNHTWHMLDPLHLKVNFPFSIKSLCEHVC